jgi:drug/metabolite transporter (DMT)-like permease
MTSTVTTNLASRREGWLAFGALVLGALAMASSPNFVRWADVGPFTSAFWRVFIALPVLYVWMRLSERGLDPAAVAKASFSKPIWLSGFAFTGDLLCWHQSIVTTSVADATFFATTAPVWVVVFSWLLLGQQIGRETLAGLAFCMLGAGALLAETLHNHAAGALGDLEGLATGVFFGLYFLTVQAARRKASAARVTFESSVITAVILFVVAALVERHMLPQTLVGVLALVALGWVSHAGGQGLLAVALGRLSATFSSLVIFLEAIAAAGLAWLLLGEPVSRIQALGGLLILVGIYVARPRAKG